MKTIMTIDKLTTIEQLEHFLSGSQVCIYEVAGDKNERYQWIQRTLIQFRYITLSKPEKGVVVRYLMKVSGYSRQQITRLVTRYKATGKVTLPRYKRHQFRRRYSDEDIRLLAHLDEIHDTPCGAVVKKFCERAWADNDLRYERLRGISISHIYNLRRSRTYTQSRRHFTKTQSKPSAIGERRKPNPQGQPGYLRVDTVHQGDQDKLKGVYHVNLVDEVTQFQVCFSVEKISERYLIPGLESAMSRLPFKIRGFHSDNGSEYINKDVAALLKKLNVEFTKSRSRRSNDNGLVESKNASIIRKNFGYSYIAQHAAETINGYIQEPLYRYQNFHRPCFFPSIEIDEKGKEKKRYKYKNLMTPLEKLLLLPNLANHLKDDVHVDDLIREAAQLTDEQAALQLQQAKQQLFKQVSKTSA
jgi:hypothetical protein